MKKTKFKDGKNMYSNPCQYYDGKSSVDIEVEEVENGDPYCISIHTDHYNLATVMVFAKDKHQAVHIFSMAVRKMIKLDKNSFNKEKNKRLLGFIVKGEVKVEKINKNQMFKIGWASNDTI